MLSTEDWGLRTGEMVPIKLVALASPRPVVEVSRPVGAFGEDCAPLVAMLVKSVS